MRNCLYISVLLFISCGETIQFNEEELIQSSLEKKYAAFKKIQLEECRENAILDADIYVDDRIDELMRFSVLEDSVQMIEKPIRPNRPAYIDIKDPGPIKPFELKKER